MIYLLAFAEFSGPLVILCDLLTVDALLVDEVGAEGEAEDGG